MDKHFLSIVRSFYALRAKNAWKAYAQITVYWRANTSVCRNWGFMRCSGVTAYSKSTPRKDGNSALLKKVSIFGKILCYVNQWLLLLLLMMINLNLHK